jgi:hypothetical protein
MDIHSVGVNLFLAEFARKADLDRVKEGSPWKMSNNHGILLKDFDPAVKPSDVCFDRLSIWARIFKLPFGLMNDTLGKNLAGNIGLVEKVDVDNKGRAWGDFLRVRVSIKVHEPIMRCVTVFSQKRQTTDVYQVMYEKMPLFCFGCGIIGHSSLICKNPGERDMDGFLPYHGPRLCVPDDKKKNSGQRSGQSSFFSNQPEPAYGQKGPTSNPFRTPGGEGVGDVTSPKKSRKPRATRTQATGEGDVRMHADTGKGVASGTGRVSGKKRKVYRPKIQEAVHAEVHPINLPLVPAASPSARNLPPIDAVEGGSNSAADSNKKQKTEALSVQRSADQEAAAEQPCQTQ